MLARRSARGKERFRSDDHAPREKVAGYAQMSRHESSRPQCQSFSISRLDEAVTRVAGLPHSASRWRTQPIPSRLAAWEPLRRKHRGDEKQSGQKSSCSDTDQDHQHHHADQRYCPSGHNERCEGAPVLPKSGLRVAKIAHRGVMPWRFAGGGGARQVRSRPPRLNSMAWPGRRVYREFEYK